MPEKLQSRARDFPRGVIELITCQSQGICAFRNNAGQKCMGMYAWFTERGRETESERQREREGEREGEREKESPPHLRTVHLALHKAPQPKLQYVSNPKKTRSHNP